MSLTVFVMFSTQGLNVLIDLHMCCITISVKLGAVGLATYFPKYGLKFFPEFLEKKALKFFSNYLKFSKKL